MGEAQKHLPKDHKQKHPLNPILEIVHMDKKEKGQKQERELEVKENLDLDRNLLAKFTKPFYLDHFGYLALLLTSKQLEAASKSTS